MFVQELQGSNTMTAARIGIGRVVTFHAARRDRVDKDIERMHLARTG